MKTENHTRSTLGRTSLLLAASVAAVLLQTGAVMAADSPRERISINNDWRFTKNDPAGITDNLAYPRSAGGGGGGGGGRRGGAAGGGAATAAGEPQIGPYAGIATGGIAAFILPTGNSLISNPAKRFPKPAGNYGADIPYVSPTFNDTAWRQLDLPHDFGIEGPFLAQGDGSTGKLPFYGVAWYRKKLSIPATDSGKEFFLDLDGSMSFTTVWCNGQIVGGWPYGYSSWRVDLTPYVKPGGDNVLAIRLDNPNSSSRWYPGGGIYRNVWLTKTAPVHVAQWGTYITTPEVSKESATINLKVTIDNDSKQDSTVSVETILYALDAAGQKIITTGRPIGVFRAAQVQLAAGKSATSESKITLSNPHLWSPNTPNRYVAVTTVTPNGAPIGVPIDSYETPFGIRSIKYDPDTGLYVNGEHFKLNGVCNHHDLGALGTAVNVRALERQLQMLRDMGCNAIRTSHNPPAPELLDFADQMGFMVLDETFDTWQGHKSGHNNDYGGDMLFNAWHEQDTRMLVRRDRNHPSVVMWSIGNEIGEQSQGANSAVAKELAAIVHSEDNTRQVTAACNGAESAANGFSTLLDSMGFNYKPDLYISFHQNFPKQFFFSTESASTISSRGEYFFPVVPPGFGAVSAIPNPGGGGRGRGRGPATGPTTGPATAPAGGAGSASAGMPYSIDDQPLYLTAAPGGGRGGAGGAGGAGGGAGGRAGGAGRGRGPVDGTDFNSGNGGERQMSSYDLYYPGWASSPDHEFFGQDHSAACAGEFVWTGWDYIGEPTPFNSRSSYFGIIDLAGFPKDRYYIYQAHWRPELPMAHILPHWNWPERVGQVTPVHVYTSGDEAELFLNGKSLGKKKKIFEGVNGNDGQPLVVNGISVNGQPAYRIRWDDVVYQPGELKVVAYKAGKEWATDTVKTTGAAAQLKLKPDRAEIAGDGHDLSFVTLTVADAAGLMVPRSKNMISFEISGPGEIVATDNGDATDMNIFALPKRNAFNGLALAIVKAKRGQTGAITLTAKADGLTTATTTITTK